MSAGQNWLFWVVNLAGASLIAAIYIAGLVVALRRWHLGTAPRLGAIGFGLLLLNGAGRHVFSIPGPFFPGDPTNDPDTVFFRMAVISSLYTLLSGTGYLLIVLALRTALRDYERARNAPLPGPGDVWPPRRDARLE